MARPRNSEPIVTVSVRLPASLLAAIDSRLKQMRNKSPGMMLTRADYIRYALFQDVAHPDQATGNTEMRSFLATAGTWQDECSTDEIVKKIESARRSRKHPGKFQ